MNKKLLILVLGVIVLASVVQASYNISFVCPAQGCVEGREIEWNISMQNLGNKKIEIIGLEIKDSLSERTVASYNISFKPLTDIKPESIAIDPGRSASRGFKSILPKLKDNELLLYLCVTTKVNEQALALVNKYTIYHCYDDITTPLTTVDCAVDSDCKDQQACNGFACTDLKCSNCSFIKNHSCVNYDCCSSEQCPRGEYCDKHDCHLLICAEDELYFNHSCIPSICNPFEIVLNHTCIECGTSQVASNSTCIELTCDENSRLINHSCMKLQCASDESVSQRECKKLICASNEQAKDGKCQKLNCMFFQYAQDHTCINDTHFIILIIGETFMIILIIAILYFDLRKGSKVMKSLK